MSASIIKFGIVGYGRIGKRHASIINKNPRLELLGVCDVDTTKQTTQIPFFTSIEALLEHSQELDVVSICTPNGYHAEHAIKVLKANKHVVIEKPMGLKKIDCEKVLHTALSQSKNVFCVMQNRYSPPSIWIKTVLSKKLLGDIFLVQINCYWNRGDAYYEHSTWHGKKELDGGVLFTQFSHFIDMMYWLFGDITNIQSRLNNFNHQHNTEFEDSGIVSFDFLNGGMGVLNFSTSIWNKNFESSLTIIGSKGTIKIGGQYMDKVEYCNIDGYNMPTLSPTNPPNYYKDGSIGSAANHIYVFENIIDVLDGKTGISTNALEGMKVVDIIERIYKA